jgi:hypothetical protein
MQESYTAAVERNSVCTPGFTSDPYEAAWAREAIFFIRVLDQTALKGRMQFAAEISPDGMRWCPEGSVCEIAEGQEMAFLRVTHFGGWLRIRRLDDAAASPKVIVYLVLK